MNNKKDPSLSMGNEPQEPDLTNDELDSDIVTNQAVKNFESDVLDSVGETFAGEPLDNILDELDLIDSSSLDFNGY
ncbi:hypothetical protein [Vibrio owensii]|uniref:hypothetical protein n=1 Tax=Vibrio harveyi group TaxID=717610 RepID=UPI003CC65CC3